jgi:uncharacterized repeat protein (TIGR03803 family)
MRAVHSQVIGLLVAVWPASAAVQYDVVVEMDSANVGDPRGSLVFDGTTFFGASQRGGTADTGTMFRLTDGTFTLSVTHSFTAMATGLYPSSGICLANDNRLYGVTSGGANNAGIIFGQNKNGSGFTVLHDFAPPTGSDPQGTLLQASDGMLYSVAQSGTFFSRGGLYRINLNGSGYALLFPFTGTAGPFPGGGYQSNGGLIELPDGKLYGIAGTGGTNDLGVIFRVDPDGSNYEVLHHFAGPGGANPTGRLLLGSDGLLYGVSYGGGAFGEGVVYRISPNGSAFTVLHHFAEPDGITPFRGVIEAADGYLYGATFYGSQNQGVIFRMKRDGSTFAVLHRFVNGVGAQPSCELLERSPGVFFGTTSSGGLNSDGVVFRLTAPLESPRVTISGRKNRSTSKRSISVRGKAEDDLKITRVEFRLGRNWRTATGQEGWRFRIRLRKQGITRVRVRAFDNDGLVSEIKSLRVRRR